MKPIVNIDPDVMFFRSMHNTLMAHEKQLLLDLGTISGFKATSDLPRWMRRENLESLREFLETETQVQKISRYKYQLNGREVDFSPAIPLPAHRNVPVWMAQNLGHLKMARRQALPAILESLRHNNKKLWVFYPLASTISSFAGMMKSF